MWRKNNMRCKNDTIIYYVHAVGMSSIKIKHVSLEVQAKIRRGDEIHSGGDGDGTGVYLIFGTRRFVECHLNSELIIRQAEQTLWRPASRHCRHPSGGPAIYARCSGPPPATIVRCVQCAQLNFFNLFPSTQNSVN